MTNDTDKGTLLTRLARTALARHFGLPDVAPPHPAWMDQPGAVFVTLTKSGQLRGCIGSLEAWRALGKDLFANTLAAALHDPRFPPVTADELPDIHIEVSVLSPPEPMQFESEAEAMTQLRPGKDGVVFEYAGHRATFLPQVWEQLPQPRDFLAHLKVKAGLDAGFWAAGVKLSRYTVEKYDEA